MARSLWKGPVTKLESPSVNTLNRASVISPSCIGKQFAIHNGKKEHKISISIKMIGHKFGEFMATRKFANHKKIIKKLSSKN